MNNIIIMVILGYSYLSRDLVTFYFIMNEFLY